MARTRGTSLRLYPGTVSTIETIRRLAKRVDPGKRYTQADIIRDGLQAVSHRLEQALRRRGESTAVYGDDLPRPEPAPFTGLAEKPRPVVD